METSKITRPISATILASCLATIATHVYLAQQHIITKYTSAESSPLCNINSFLNCGTSIASSYSEFANTPISFFGIATQLLILFFFLTSFLKETLEEKAEYLKMALGLSLFSFCASLVMGSISLFVLKSLCPFCTLTYFLSLVTLIGLWLTQKKISIENKNIIKKFLLSMVLIFVGGWAAGQVVLQKYRHSDFDQITELRIQNWKAQSEQKINLISPQKFGPDSAKMKIVEFADFLCGHCKAAYPKLHSFAQARNDVQILFQTWPLDGCAGPDNNPGRRCELAKISYCANLQDKGNEVQEYLFTMGEILAGIPDLKEEIRIMSQKVILDPEKMIQCFSDLQTLANVRAQVELGKSLGVEGTPALFINNRSFQGGADIPSLEKLYNLIFVNNLFKKE